MEKRGDRLTDKVGRRWRGNGLSDTPTFQPARGGNSVAGKFKLGASTSDLLVHFLQFLVSELVA